MPGLSLRSSITWVYCVGLWIVLCVWGVLHYPGMSIPEWVVLYTITGLLILVERFNIPVSDRGMFTLETVYLIGFSLVYPVQLTLWAGLTFALVSSFRRRHWYIQVMNASGLAMCALIAKIAYLYVGGTDGHVSVRGLTPIVVYAVVYLIINVLFVLTYFVIVQGLRGLNEVRNIVTPQFLMIYGITMMMGLLLGLVLSDAHLGGALLFTGLTLLVSYSYRDYFRMANHFKELSIKDELTGLYNFRWIQTWMDEQIALQQPFALLMLDIDHFKHYNEVWGHVEGDAALKFIADLLREHQSGNEQLARYSGEEFIIALPSASVTEAEQKAEQLRQAVENAVFPTSDKLPGENLTVSLGIATYPDMAESKRDLLMMVDDALYKGKFAGRNKVSLYTSVIDEMKQQLEMDQEQEEIINTIKVFLAILNSKDRYTYAHTERDVLYVEALGKRIGLGEQALRYLRFGAFLHDIGKVEIPLEVLTKRGPLTREEWEIMKSHVEIGEKIAAPIPSLAPCLPIIRHHHERFDGNGYPDKLAGHQIPLEARILTIADSFDAMTTSRPYQRKRMMEEAFVELRNCAGKQFDPDLIEPFIEVVRQIGLLSEDQQGLS